MELGLKEFLLSSCGGPALHSHPEIEIVFVVAGFGRLVVWNKIETFRPGDIIVIGSGAPHVWLSDATGYHQVPEEESRVIVTYFNTGKFEGLFHSAEEFSAIRQLIAQATGGIRIYGAVREVIGQKLVSLCAGHGFEKVQGLLQIMHTIATTHERRFIAKRFCRPDNERYSARMIAVMNYIRENFRKQISLDEIAQVAGMSKQYFCRFFRHRTRKTFLQFLNEHRINHACELLMSSGLPIARISGLCGFTSVGWFCKVFKEQMGSSPHQYKEEWRK